MSRVPRRLLATGPVAALLALALTAQPASARGTYRILQREGVSRSQLTLSPTGLRFDGLAPLRRRGRARPFLTMIVRYRDARMLLIDPLRRRYEALSLTSAVSSYRTEAMAARKGQPSERLPAPPGTKRRKGQAPIRTPRATLKRLRLTRRIGGLRARAYLLTQGGSRERLWFAGALPRPPANVRRLLARATSGAAAGPFGRATGSQAGRIPLRIDVRMGRRWRTSLRTTRIVHSGARRVSLHAPKGFRHKALLPATKRAHAADVPATPIPCGLGLNCVSPLLWGPVSGHPSIWALFWGSHFDERKDYVYSIIHGLENMVGDQFADPGAENFFGPLGQYGVGRGRFLGYDIIDENPPNSVGSWNFLRTGAFVFTHRFGSDAPNYWWRGSDEDPIYAIFVDQSEVDSSGWGGYHFFTPTEGILFAFLVHPNMPWLIVKVPSPTTLPEGHGAAGYKSAVDRATELASHELVEAATDPYPFLSWADPLKVPIWEQGEIADICQEGDHRPWGDRTRIIEGGTAVQPYWDNDAGACAPDARPTLRIAYPSDHQSYGWKTPVSLIAHGDDAFDGNLPDSAITWTDDKDGALGTGSFITANHLSIGVHHITASATDSTGGTRTTDPLTVTMTVAPPQVRITAPASGSSFPSDQLINLRGTAFDPQDGDLAATATWSVDGTPVGTGATLLSHRIATEGTHTVTLAATDSAGLRASDSITLTIGPGTGKPSVAITAPENHASLGYQQATAFTATASAPGGATIPDSGYHWTDSVDGALGTGPSITKTLSGFACGNQSHHVTVTVTDSFSRTASDAIDVDVVQIC